jgi:DNA-binding Lrp family transcriptional regulator
MTAIPFEFESKFNGRYGIVTRRMLRMLSEDSRVALSEMSAKLGISRQAIKKRMTGMYGELGITNTIALDEEKLGLANPHLILVRFKRRPDREMLLHTFQRSYVPQLVVSTHGEYDLLVYANAASKSEYVRWDMGMHIALADYGMTWTSLEMTHRQLGFFPLRNEAIMKSALPEKYKDMLVLLNSDSGITFREMASKLGMHINSAMYTYRKIVEQERYVKRFSIALRPLKGTAIIGFFCRYTPGPDHESNSSRARRAFMSDDKDPAVSRYLVCSQLIGGYDFFSMGVFDDEKAAYRMGVSYHRQCHGKNGLKTRHAYFDDVLLGTLPLYSIDTGKEYNAVRWEIN